MITEFYGVTYNEINIKDLAKTLSDSYSYGFIKYALFVLDEDRKHWHFYIIYSRYVTLDYLEFLLGKKIMLFDINKPFEKIRKYMIREDNKFTFEIGFRNEEDI